jgi:hypothetical protein
MALSDGITRLEIPTRTYDIFGIAMEVYKEMEPGFVEAGVIINSKTYLFAIKGFGNV